MGGDDECALRPVVIQPSMARLADVTLDALGGTDVAKNDVIVNIDVDDELLAR